MPKRRCEVCGEPLTGRQRRFDRDACRAKAWRAEQRGRAKASRRSASSTERPEPAFGPIRQSAERLIARLEREERVDELDAAHLAIFRALADRLDGLEEGGKVAQIGEAPLWKEFRAVADQLREVDDNSDALGDLLKAISAGTP